MYYVLRSMRTFSYLYNYKQWVIFISVNAMVQLVHLYPLQSHNNTISIIININIIHIHKEIFKRKIRIGETVTILQ